MPVITPDGIVGKVRDVFPKTSPHTAQVLLINDQTSGAGVILATPASAPSSTEPPPAASRSAISPRTAGIKAGEPVLTSGGDQVFPRGLPVGTIESIAADPEHQPYTAIRVKPAANLFQLEEVLIITGREPSLPAGTLQALARGAEASLPPALLPRRPPPRPQLPRPPPRRRRLPPAPPRRLSPIACPASGSDCRPELARSEGQSSSRSRQPKAAGGVVPHPVPALHVDRYSPGTTPPASALTPGAAHHRALPDSLPAQPVRRPKRSDAEPSTDSSPTPSPTEPPLN